VGRDGAEGGESVAQNTLRSPQRRQNHGARGRHGDGGGLFYLSIRDRWRNGGRTMIFLSGFGGSRGKRKRTWDAQQGQEAGTSCRSATPASGRKMCARCGPECKGPSPSGATSRSGRRVPRSGGAVRLTLSWQNRSRQAQGTNPRSPDGRRGPWRCILQGPFRAERVCLTKFTHQRVAGGV